jgi:hypothetical protein
MDKSFVYSNIPANNDLASLGWFQPKIPFGVIGNANYVKFINEQNTNISKNTLVA